MTNWIELIETNMENCPSAEEIEREVKTSGGKLSATELWKSKVAKEARRKRSELDR